MVNLINLCLRNWEVLRFPDADTAPQNFVGHPMGLLLALTYTNH